MESVVNSNLGSLILQGKHQGHRYVALGFNPFPYLGKRNLPMSVLTLNILGYLSGFGSEDAGHRTGEPWIVPAGVNKIITPRRKNHPRRAWNSVHSGKPAGDLSADRARIAKTLARGESRRP